MVGSLLSKGAHTRHIETYHEPACILLPQKIITVNPFCHRMGSFAVNSINCKTCCRIFGWGPLPYTRRKDHIMNYNKEECMINDIKSGGR